MISEEVINSWGVPDVLKDLNIQFHFTDDLGDERLIGKGCYIDSNGAKFFLFDPDNKQSIFTMDFYLRNRQRDAFHQDEKNDGPYMYLQHVGTAPSFRKKGIATFYIKKLVEICSNNNIGSIALNIAVPNKNLENSLSKDELKLFYKKFETNNVKIIFI